MMQPTTQVKETAQDAEQRLWSQYMLALCDEDRLWHECQKAWREHVMVNNGTTDHRWSSLSDRWRAACDHTKAVKQSWARVAYPLYGWPVSDEDESSS